MLFFQFNPEQKFLEPHYFIFFSVSSKNPSEIIAKLEHAQELK
jgi:hypothetical protein